jgi:uncharacterized protein (UPF0261 family)
MKMSREKPIIAIIGCFDTKADIFSFLRAEILALGAEVFTINAGVFGSADAFPVDIEADYMAELAGTTLAEMRKGKDRGQALERMAKGASQVLKDLNVKGSIDAVIGMGGGGGTYLALTALQTLPIGFPKACLSTIATHDVSHLVGNKDIVLIPSVVDVAGLNSIIKPIIQQAAAAIVGMARQKGQKMPEVKKRIAISMFGNTTKCVDAATEILVNSGYEVMAFHATGTGGKAMEALIREGMFDAVLDVTTTELVDELCGGILSAGPDRMMAAIEIGIPLVIVPGCVDMVNFGVKESVPEKYSHRKFYQWAPDVTLMRTNKEEMIALGKSMAEKVNRTRIAHNISIMIPTLGFSQLDAKGGAFYDPESNEVFHQTLTRHLPSSIKVQLLPAHINDLDFAQAITMQLFGMLN